MIRDDFPVHDFVRSVAKYVRNVCVPAEDEVEERDEVPERIVEDFRTMGYFGWSIPTEYGGAGMTTEELVFGALELSQCSPAFRARVGANTGIASETLINHGTEEQKRRFLPPLASGEFTGAFALTEPGAGSDATALQTRAARTEGGWLLNGTKCFITNAPIADLFTVFARTDGQRGSRGISAFLVPKGTPGLSVGKPYKKMGQAGSPVSDVYLRDCFVPDGQLLGGEVGTAFRWAMETLTKQRIHLAALCTGAAIRLQRDTLAYARQRKQFDAPIGNQQLVQAMIADSQTEIFASRCMVLETARRRDDGHDVRATASMCKYFASETAKRVADRAVQVHGGYGYIAGNGIERMYRDVRLFPIYEGTSQIHQLNIARTALHYVEAEVVW